MDTPVKTELKHKRRISNSWTLVIALAAVILAVISLWMMNQTSRTTITLTNQLNKIEELNQDLSLVKNSQEQMRSEYQSDLNNVLKTTSQYPANIALINANLLLNLANDRLQVEYNIPAALSLLNAANTALKDSNTPEATLVKQLIVTNIAILKTLPTVDVQALYLQLSIIDSQISTLPLANVLQPIKPKTPTSTSHTWRDGLRNSWESLKSLIIIRHNDQTTPELLSISQTTNLFQNLHTLISQTQLAVLNHQDLIYHHNLNQLTDYLNKYFDINDKKTKQVIQSLQALNKINIHPTMPDVAGMA